MSYEPQQLEFPSLPFPKDRTVLYVTEVAMKLRVTDQRVLELVEEGKLQAIIIGGGGGISGEFQSRHIRHFKCKSQLPPVT